MRELRVLLVQPDYKDCVQTLFSIYNTEEGIGYKPPLGLLYLAAAIKKWTVHSVDVLDCQLDKVDAGNIHQHVTGPYDVIGISAWTDFWYQAHSVGKKLKEMYPGAHLVIGGPHANIFPDELLKIDFIDSIILSDGELPLVKLLGRLSGEDSSNTPIPGLYFKGRDNGAFVPYNYPELDQLPFPDRTLLPIHRYTSVLSSHSYVTSMITSRGCPFKCVYCKLDFQKPMKRSAENVVDEFEEIAKLGIKEVEVYDDTFNWSHKRTLEICEGILQRNIKIKWAIRDRVNTANEDVLRALKAAGCYRIHYGIETGSDRVMEISKKQITTAQARNAVKLAKKHGFSVLAYFMYGLPGETLNEAYETMDFAMELDPDYAEFSITVPYPGTESYDNSLKEGIIPFDYWREFTRNPTPKYNIPYVIENLISRENLVRLRDDSVRRFYFRPTYMVRELFKVRTFGEFKRKSKMGLGLFGVLQGHFSR